MWLTPPHILAALGYPDDGEHDAESDLKPDWKTNQYQGIYSPPGGYGL